MTTDDPINFYEELDNDEQMNNFLQRDKRRQRFPERHFKYVREANADVLKQDDSHKNFKFTYPAARFEEWWLLDSLGDFYEHQYIRDVLRRVKGGKEASVYQCYSGTAIQDADLVAAKVYRPRSLRNLKNDHTYREGRVDLDDEGKQVLDDRMQRAMQKRTDYGQELLHQSWIAYEFTAMQTLHRSGVDVPQPVTMAKNAILMGFIGDETSAAPALSEISLERSEAKNLFERVRRNIETMLAHDIIHGDLSAYNILYWEGDIALIDFPQVVAPEANRNAYRIFERDVVRVCSYFNKQGLKLEGRRIASEMWKSRGLRMEPEVHPRLLDAEDPQDRALWEKR
jgi:RIO kinase 1